MNTTQKPLTEKQTKVLAALPDDTWMFPTKEYREATFEALVYCGLARRKLGLASQNFAKGTANFKSCYQRTPAGREAVKQP